MQKKRTFSKDSTTLSLFEMDNKAVDLAFTGGDVSSDGGLLLLREVENQVGIIKAFAEAIEDDRDPRYVKHALAELALQRVGQIACGYEDADDADTLRDDPIFKMFAGRMPESAEALASQPTHSRFENAISRKSLYKLAEMFCDNFIRSYEKAPEMIVLDFDDTEDPVHGAQQLALFNGHYGGYCFLPLHVYEGISGKLVATILRPGKRATGKGYLSFVKRIVTKLRQAWPDTLIVVRGDSHFATPEIFDWIDKQPHVHFVLGLTSNAVLRRLADSTLRRAKKTYEIAQRPVRFFRKVRYQAASWSKTCCVVIKVEYSHLGENIRFVVTDCKDADARTLYQEIYCKRGKAELCIKEHKLELKSDRTSCQRFLANQFRLFLHSAAYVLLHAFRANILQNTQWAKATIKTIQLRLLKIAARVSEFKTRIKVEFPASCPVKQGIVQSCRIFEILRAKT